MWIGNTIINIKQKVYFLLITMRLYYFPLMGSPWFISLNWKKKGKKPSSSSQLCALGVQKKLYNSMGVCNPPAGGLEIAMREVLNLALT